MAENYQQRRPTVLLFAHKNERRNHDGGYRSVELAHEQGGEQLMGTEPIDEHALVPA